MYVSIFYLSNSRYSCVLFLVDIISFYSLFLFYFFFFFFNDTATTEIYTLSLHDALPISHNWRGSCHAGGSGPAQSGAMRPVLGWAQHRMPIPGLYQTGATTHPGGSVTGGPGRNAATVMLKDFGTSIEEVVRA